MIFFTILSGGKVEDIVLKRVSLRSLQMSKEGDKDLCPEGEGCYDHTPEEYEERIPALGAERKAVICDTLTSDPSPSPRFSFCLNVIVDPIYILF